MILYGRESEAKLNRVIAPDLQPVTPPSSGIAISSWLARRLDVGPGDRVEVDLLEGRRRTETLTVTALAEDFIGMRAIMDMDALARILGEAPVANQVELRLDPRRLDALYARIKQTPAISGIALQIVSLAKFREAVAIIVTAMASIYTGLAAVIAFGVVYNSARITLSEHGRELASLRVLGFGRAETFRVLVGELAILVLLAQPLGWAAGYGISLAMKLEMDADLMRMPLALEAQTYALSSAAVLAGAAASALLLWRRIGALDLIATMKTRE